MILFILEGKKREDFLFRSLEYLFFPYTGERIVCSYGNNIYNLYKRLRESQEDIISLILPELIVLDEYDLSPETKMSDFAEVYLFFDYDNQDSAASDSIISEMLEFFDNETENGKLYISYPMIESIYYTKLLPDKNFYSYTYPLEASEHFKTAAHAFSDYKSLDFLMLKINRNETGRKSVVAPDKNVLDKLRNNWILLRDQNVCKANYICCRNNEMPKSKELVNQNQIFNFQKLNYIEPEKKIGILNSFAMFLYDYFRH